MAKYLVRASYTAEGVRGVMKEGGSGRRAAVEKALAAMGGRLEAFYFAFGEDDALVVCDIPDAVSALAISMAVNATGLVRASLTPLASVEEVDAAGRQAAASVYKAPGA
jgi:uncharacterized protein with GYD domain